MLSCEGPSWTASFGEAGGNSSSPGPAGWDSPGGSGGDKQEAGWANFTEFQPFSRWEPNTLHTIVYTFDVSVWDIVTRQFIKLFLVRPFLNHQHKTLLFTSLRYIPSGVLSVLCT